MSLEEFFNDDTLGDSVWDEDDINIEAISSSLSNTTSLDVLKHTPLNLGAHTRHGDDRYPSWQHPQSLVGPPFIVKFSKLPPQFSVLEIEDLFQSKFTKFVKFKIFWELKKNPTMHDLKASQFDAYFVRDHKVAFVELYSAHDTEKIISQWTVPLEKYHGIIVTQAEFSDFKNYMEKNQLLNETDDPSKPYRLPAGSTSTGTSTSKTRRRSSATATNATPSLRKPRQKSTSNPFGSAKPVDTQSKILDIEQKLDELHIDDTTTLRRVSLGEESRETVLKKDGKITVLKRDKPNEAEEEEHKKSKEKIQEQRPISYSAMLQKSVNNTPSPTTASMNIPSAKTHLPTTGPAPDTTATDSNAVDSDPAKENTEQSENTGNFTFKDSSRDATAASERNQQRSSYRGGSNPRGRGGSRGRGGARGGRGGGGGSGIHNKHSNTGDGFRPNKFNSGSNTNNPYSVFRPASGFLRESINNPRGNHRGGSFNNRGRGGFSQRNNGFTAV